MALWWYAQPGQVEAPYILHVCRAAGIREACELFGQTWPCPQVRELKGSGVASRLEALREGQCCVVEAPRYPSYYDRF